MVEFGKDFWKSSGQGLLFKIVFTENEYKLLKEGAEF